MNDNVWTGKSVIIADDSILLQNEIAQIFDSIGMNVVGLCGDGHSVVELYKQHKPDLVSMDIIMPEMHGIAGFRLLREIDPHLRCVFVSCLSMNPSFVTEFDGEIDKNLFLNKPLTKASLEACLVRIFSHAASPAEPQSA